MPTSNKSSRFDTLAWARSLRESDLSATERAVGWALALRAGATGQCWPSVATLAGDTNLSRRAVQQSLHALVQGGWVEVKSAKSGYTPDYQLCTKGSERGAQVGAHVVQGRGARGAQGGCTTCAGGVHVVRPKLVIEEPIEEKKEDAREALSFSDEEQGARARWQAALGELAKAWTQKEV